MGPSESHRPVASVGKTDGSSVSFNRLRNLREQAKVRMDLKRDQAILNKTGSRPDLDPYHGEKQPVHQTNIYLEPGPAAEDLNDGGQYGPATLDQKMDEFLAKRQEFEELEQTQKQAYVDNFIYESRKIGYEVKVDRESLKILSVKRRR